MTTAIQNKPRIIFLFSDTGSGHRSAAEAIIEAIELEFPKMYTCKMVDFFKEYSPLPLNFAGPAYPLMSRMEYLWEFTFKASDNPDFMRVLFSAFWPYIRRGVFKMLRENPGDIYVSVHPLINIPFLRAMRRKKVKAPFIIVVTDLVTTHTAWFAKEADLISIPTEQARKPAQYAGIDPDKLRVIGLPVAERFCKPPGDKKTLREKLGWPQNKTIVILVGGGEGMGPLAEVSKAINKEMLDVGLIVITGRNKKLKAELEALSWNIPTKIYGFVTDMPDFMRAADILLTKAGPGTISEALIANLPIILYHRIPGQEEGNVSYVIDEGAGVWAPDTDDIIDTIKDWLENPDKRLQAIKHAKRLAKPNASHEIARMIIEMLENNK
ncbi:MAG: glycosyltransferase [Anaerolineaceae bacterium]|nr:glycosyltransferase [Anaerolineaceae bacterium]